MAGRFKFNVSDAYEVPSRGHVLRLKTIEGTPEPGAVKPGQELILASPTGKERRIRILDHAITGGKVSQKRLDTLRELDVVIASDEVVIDGETVGIGWTATSV